MTQPLTLLLMDRSRALFQLLESELSENAIKVIRDSGPKATSRILKRKPMDIMVLDYGLIHEHDVSFIDLLRKKGNMSLILMLSYSGKSQECIDCLSAGADDYLARPFAHDELIARIRSLARYAQPHDPEQTTNDVKVLQLDDDSFRATFGHRDLSLTKTEYRILATIERYNGGAVTHEALLEELHGYEADLTRNSIEVHICSIRRKLKWAGAPATLHTRRGFGYYTIQVFDKPGR